MVIIESNRQREKTASEVMREAVQIGLIETAKAKARMLAGQADPVPNSAQGKGKTRTKVAEQVGRKPTTFRSIQKVWEAANDDAASAPIRDLAAQQMAALDTGETTAHAADKAGRPLTFRQFIEAPYPVGVGSTLEQIKKIVALQSRNEAHPETAAKLASMRRAVDDLVNEPLPAHGGDRSAQGSNAILPVGEDRGREYTVRRLKRDRPDLAALVLGGALSAAFGVVSPASRATIWRCATARIGAGAASSLAAS